MASKELKAKVTIVTSAAEKNLKALSNKIKAIDKSVNKLGSKITLDSKLKKIATNADSATAKMNKLASATRKVSYETKKTGDTSKNVASGIISSLGKIGGLLIGVTGTMSGLDYVKNTSDTITSAKNKLNYLNGGDSSATEDSLNKMFTASLNSRSDYGDMISNVSKSMALASDSFKGNVDNAIRFQEIMAKSYAIGGASAAEQSSSMYQMIQALGSGILQGDELRSVREGAPLAYKAIEEFAQGVYKTDESLKDLASQGKITSDIVVAAMMQAGESIDKAFEDTDMTIAQVFTNLKSVATNAFRPLQEKINKFINSDKGKQVIEGIEKAIESVANAAEKVLDFMISIYDFFSSHWTVIEPILLGIAAALGVILAYQTAIAVMNAVNFVITHWQLVLIAAVLGIIVGLIIYIYNLTKSLSTALFVALSGVGAILLIIGIITGNVFLIVVGAILLLAGLFAKFAEQIIGAIWWIGALFKNVGLWCANLGLAIHQLFTNIQTWFDNLAEGLLQVLLALANNIKAAFVNTWYEAKAEFWDFVYAVLDGVRKVANLANSLLGIFGVEIDVSGLENSIREADAKARASRDKKLDYESLSEAFNRGNSTYSYGSVSDAFNTFDTFQSGWGSEAYNAGAKIGAGITSKIDYFGKNLESKLKTGRSIQEQYAMENAIDSGNYDFNTPTTATGYDPEELLKGVDNIDNNTGAIKDSMALTEEDLEYLRKVADMEWKKEYTTAAITVDMSNYNTINGEGDLDGIVTKLADKLYEEMDYLANGTYA